MFDWQPIRFCIHPVTFLLPESITTFIFVSTMLTFYLIIIFSL